MWPAPVAASRPGHPHGWQASSHRKNKFFPGPRWCTLKRWRSSGRRIQPPFIRYRASPPPPPYPPHFSSHLLLCFLFSPVQVALTYSFPFFSCGKAACWVTGAVLASARDCRAGELEGEVSLPLPTCVWLVRVGKLMGLVNVGCAAISDTPNQGRLRCVLVAHTLWFTAAAVGSCFF